MISFWKALLGHLERGERVLIALVIANSPHSPGTAGAKMFFSESGQTKGTIGGGVMEHRLEKKSPEIFRQGDSWTPVVEKLVHRKLGTGAGKGQKSGMICAGEQTNLYYLCQSARDQPSIQRLVSLLEGDRSGSLLISSQNTLEVVEKSPQLNQSPYRLNRAREHWDYEEELLNRKRLAILGGGHCSWALSQVMSPLGYLISIFDIRPKLPTFLENPWAFHRHILGDYGEGGAKISYPELTYSVVMTSDEPSDVRALLGLLPLPLPYIGVMGSGAKIRQIFRDLQKEGWDIESMDNLYMPIGLPIGSHTPEEIGLSIGAQILQERQKG